MSQTSEVAGPPPAATPPAAEEIARGRVHTRPRRRAVLGGSFNPPGIHHRAIAQALSARFDEVVVVPCGPRPDKRATEDVPAVDRAAMTDMTFQGLPGVRVDLWDMELPSFTRTHALETRYGADEAEVWHVVGADHVRGGGRGEAEIQTRWERGQEIWRRLRFLVAAPPGGPPRPEDMPPHAEVVEVDAPGLRTSIRQAALLNHSLDDLVVPTVARYIARHQLYRGTLPQRTTRLTLAELHPLIVADPRSPEAQELARRLRADLGLPPLPPASPRASVGASAGASAGASVGTPGDAPEEPALDVPARANLIVVVGGDGMMLRAIRSHWRRRLPFYGINTGHMGFLLNQRGPEEFLGQELVVEQLPLLRVSVTSQDGLEATALAFNDAWVERASGQTAWLSVRVNDRERLPKLIADGALVATAAGSTSYARAMGAHALPLNTPALLLVGSNVLRPAFWQPVVLPLDAGVSLTTLDPDKRPLRAYIDGVPQGLARRLEARVSRVAAAELAFAPLHHPAEKLAQIQFPLTSE